MNRKTEYNVEKVKRLTKAILKYQKEYKLVAAGITSKEANPEWGSIKTHTDFINEERERKLKALNERIAELEDELFRIKFIAFHKATKLSKTAKKLGYLSNEAYINAEAELRGYNPMWAESMGTVGFINYNEVWETMSEKEANKISRR